jgi:hypothetical protein
VVEDVNVLDPIAQVTAAFGSSLDLFNDEVLIRKNMFDALEIDRRYIPCLNFCLEVLEFIQEDLRVLELDCDALPWVTTRGIKSSLLVNGDKGIDGAEKMHDTCKSDLNWLGGRCEGLQSLELLNVQTVQGTFSGLESGNSGSQIFGDGLHLCCDLRCDDSAFGGFDVGSVR